MNEQYGYSNNKARVDEHEEVDKCVHVWGVIHISLILECIET